MGWWMAGCALSVLVALSVRDVARPGVVSAPALLVLRALGGLGLVAMAALSLRAGSSEGALVAGAAALPLLVGLTGGVLRARPDRRAAPTALPRRPAARPAPGAGDARRRAA